MRIARVIGTLCLLNSLSAGYLSPPAYAAEPKWESLLKAVDAEKHAVAGSWKTTDGGVQVAAASGARLVVPFVPQGEYDFRVSFTRRTGMHSIALIFPHGKGQVAFEVDAWGQHLGGLQNVAGKSIRENPTRKENVTLKNGQRYTMSVEVRQGQIRALLDDQVIANLKTDGSDLSVPDLWQLPDRKSLGLGAWESETVFHSIEARMVNGDPLPGAAPVAFPRKTAATETKPSPTRTPAQPPASKTNSGKSNSGKSAGAKSAGGNSAGGKRVLIVIANEDFFFREYAEPRAELERAGFKATVAAARKAPCRPHAGSGQGNGNGIVQPDLALADVKAADYDTILFSGGWGASAYQFAFDGRYNNPVYNGDRAVKATVNRLINEFLSQDKYVCALCNAVSVLAWARVDGQSPLRGKKVCAPTRQAAAGIYNGQQAQPSCRWHPEANGAILSPPGSIGKPGTAEDDVLVDGKIVTGEDDIAAREMGRRIVELLSPR